MRTVYLDKNIPKGLLIKALRPLWPGVVFSPLSLTRFAELPDPALPGPRWVRVRNRLAGICGTDLHLVRVDAHPETALLALPGFDRYYLGHEVVGEVTEVGPAVTALKPGDRVLMDAEAPTCLTQEIEPPCRHCAAGNYLLCENASASAIPHAIGGGWSDGLIAHETAVYRVPGGLDNDAAVLIEPLSVGVRAVLRRLPGAGERALVVGCGMIGLAVIGALRALSPECHVAAMSRYPQQAEMARRLGAELLGPGDPFEAVARATGGKLYRGSLGNRMILGGFDVVYDCVGSGRTLQNSLRWARGGGTVLLIGGAFAPLRADLTPLWYQEVDLIGTYGHGMEEWDGVRQSTYDITAGLLLAGKLTSTGLITHRFPLERWQDAVRTAMDKRSGAIKVVLDCARLARLGQEMAH